MDPDGGMCLALGNDAPRQLDLCDGCRDRLWGPLASIYRAARPAPDTAPKKHEKQEPLPCPICDYVCPSRSALRSHLEVRHETDTGKWQYEQGHAVDGVNIPVPHVCETCGKAYVNRQGLAQHVASAAHQARAAESA